MRAWKTVGRRYRDVLAEVQTEEGRREKERKGRADIKKLRVKQKTTTKKISGKNKSVAMRKRRS